MYHWIHDFAPPPSKKSIFINIFYISVISIPVSETTVKVSQMLLFFIIMYCIGQDKWSSCKGKAMSTFDPLCHVFPICVSCVQSNTPEAWRGKTIQCFIRKWANTREKYEKILLDFFSFPSHKSSTTPFFVIALGISDPTAAGAVCLDIGLVSCSFKSQDYESTEHYIIWFHWLACFQAERTTRWLEWTSSHSWHIDSKYGSLLLFCLAFQHHQDKFSCHRKLSYRQRLLPYTTSLIFNCRTASQCALRCEHASSYGAAGERSK